MMLIQIIYRIHFGKHCPGHTGFRFLLANNRDMNEINYKNEIWCGINMGLQNLKGNPMRICWKQWTFPPEQ